MNKLQQFPMDEPATYRIQVQGCPSRAWVEAMWGNEFETSEDPATPDQSVFVGEVLDQSALVGLINAFYNLGHAIISIEQIPPEELIGSVEEE